MCVFCTFVPVCDDIYCRVQPLSVCLIVHLLILVSFLVNPCKYFLSIWMVKITFFSNWCWCRPMHEITFSTEDKPKLLSQVYDRFVCRIRSVNLFYHLVILKLLLHEVALELLHLRVPELTCEMHIFLNIDHAIFLLIPLGHAHAIFAVDRIACWDWAEHRGSACIFHSQSFSLDVFVVDGWPYEVLFILISYFDSYRHNCFVQWPFN